MDQTECATSVPNLNIRHRETLGISATKCDTGGTRKLLALYPTANLLEIKEIKKPFK